MTTEHVLFFWAKWTLAVILAQWASIPMAIHILIGFMALDMASGLLAAIVKRKLSSSTSLIGISKKILILIVILAAHLLEKLIGTEFGIEKIAAFAYTVNEFISVTENCGMAGVWVPAPVLTWLVKLKPQAPPPKEF